MYGLVFVRNVLLRINIVIHVLVQMEFLLQKGTGEKQASIKRLGWETQCACKH